MPGSQALFWHPESSTASAGVRFSYSRLCSRNPLKFVLPLYKNGHRWLLEPSGKILRCSPSGDGQSELSFCGIALWTNSFNAQVQGRGNIGGQVAAAWVSVPSDSTCVKVHDGVDLYCFMNLQASIYIYIYIYMCVCSPR